MAYAPFAGRRLEDLSPLERCVFYCWQQNEMKMGDIEAAREEYATLRTRVAELEGMLAHREKNTLRYEVKEDPSGEAGMVWVAMDQDSLDYQEEDDATCISFGAEDFIGVQMTVIFSEAKAPTPTERERDGDEERRRRFLRAND